MALHSSLFKLNSIPLCGVPYFQWVAEHGANLTTLCSIMNSVPPPAIFFKALKSWEKWSSPPPPVSLYPLLEQKPSSKLQRLGWAVATVFSSCLKNIIPFLNCSLKLLPISTQTTHCYISIRKWWEAKIYYWCHILKGQHWDLRLHVGTCRNWT